MASWRGIAFLWSMTSLFFLVAGVLALTGGLWFLGSVFVVVAILGVGVGIYSLQRFRRETRGPGGQR